MQLKRSKPLNIFLVVVVVAIWANGIRVFINSSQENDYKSLIQQDKKNQAQGVDVGDSPRSSTRQTKKSPTDRQSTSASSGQNGQASPESSKKQKMAVDLSQIKSLSPPQRDIFSYGYRPVPRKKEKEESVSYESLETGKAEASDSGPKIQLVGIITGQKPSVLLVSEKGDKKMLHEGDVFYSNEIKKIYKDKILVAHFSGKSYVVDRSGWRPVK